MTLKEVVKMVEHFVGTKKDPMIEIFTNVGHPASLISIEYCEVNNVIMMNYETKE